MRTYFQNGVIKEVPNLMDGVEEFYIQELESEIANSYTYPGDSINYILDGELSTLYDTLRNMVFDDVDQYYLEVSMLPIWVQEAGQSSDCAVSADIFSKWLGNSNIPNLYKHLYLVDCQFLVGSIQNLLCAMEDAFIRYYKLMATSDNPERYEGLTDPNGTIFVIS